MRILCKNDQDNIEQIVYSSKLQMLLLNKIWQLITSKE